MSGRIEINVEMIDELFDILSRMAEERQNRDELQEFLDESRVAFDFMLQPQKTDD